VPEAGVPLIGRKPLKGAGDAFSTSIQAIFAQIGLADIPDSGNVIVLISMNPFGV
jgi:hypothetical protein